MSEQSLNKSTNYYSRQRESESFDLMHMSKANEGK